MAELQGGACIGEWGIVTGKPRTATAKTRVQCDLLYMSKEMYQSVLHSYRRGHLALQEVAELAEKPPALRKDLDVQL